jgi:hypothetical protein
VVTAAVLAASRAAAELVSGVAEAPVWALTDEQVGQALRDLQAARCGIEAMESQLVRLAEERQVPRAEGCASTTAWLAGMTRMSQAGAARTVKTARACDEPVVLAAWSDGRLSREQVQVIVDAVAKLPGWFGDTERTDAAATLVEHAQSFDLDDLKRLANRVVEVVDPDGADEALGEQLRREEERAWDSTRLRIRGRGDGVTRGEFQVPDQFGDQLRAAVEALAAPRRAEHAATRWGLGLDDVRSLPREQRLGLAFCELIEHLPEGSLPQAGGLAATVGVFVDVDTLRTGDGTATTSAGGTVSARTAQRLACNAHLVGLFLDPDGRVTCTSSPGRLYSRNQRVALATRDRGCVWAGCDRPPAQCEAHHLIPWSAGGPTTLENGVLLCFFHHHLLHEGHGWELVRAADGIVDVIPPPRLDPHRTPRRHARYTALRPRAA